MKRGRERHLPYFRVLEAIRTANGCALCALEETALSRYFDGILYEKVNDPKIRDELRKSFGFCSRHAHRLADFGDGLGTAILYQDQISLIIEAVEKAAAAAVRGGRRGGGEGRLQPEGSCPACRFAEQLRSRNIRTLLDALEDAEMAEALQASPGLCYPHLVRAMEQAQEDRRRQLVEIHRSKLAALLHMLAEYRRKQDHRFAAEADAEERDSWLRAVETAVGRRGVF